MSLHRLTLICVLASIPGCASLPGFDSPELSFAPQLILYELQGDATMQSALGNPTGSIDTRDFGADDRDSSFGGVLGYGDGFSGLEVTYYRYDLDGNDTGTLASDFGNIPAGSTVRSEFTMNEIRLGYTAEVFRSNFTIREDEDDLLLRLGLGAAITHREGEFKVFRVPAQGNSQDQQKFDFKDDGLPYASARARIDYLSFGLQLDYAINPDLTFGSDFDGSMQDLEVTLSYNFIDQGIALTAGWRRSEIPAKGREGALTYDTDFRLEGFILGLSATF